MARDPHRPAAAICWPGCGAIAVLVAVLVLGVQAPLHAESGAAAIAPEDGRVDLTLTPVVPVKQGPVTGNPLWAVPLGALSQTVVRPVFSPSRRPPSPPVVAAPAVLLEETKIPAPAEPDHPLLMLLGTIVGEFDSIGIFLDESSNNVIRLRAGEALGGWTLRSVGKRVANFERDHLHATLEFPSPGAEQRILSVAAGPAGTERPAIRGNDQTVGFPSGNRVRPRPRKL